MLCALPAAAEVEYAEVDQVLYATDTPPSDPLYTAQYHLSRVRAPAAWDATTGNASVRVCVVDTGANYL